MTFCFNRMSWLPTVNFMQEYPFFVPLYNPITIANAYLLWISFLRRSDLTISSYFPDYGDVFGLFVIF